ncbi:MAG TPA: DUF6600 domain-containing protein [Rhodopila sp.]|uniref:DUF6600 domain-containing protein n=1 Tax=Rhodopila sp. TaxID=2480087 RepID=UPI002CE8BE28|nr:DUF6600 domain-containing protein [Rhodopila sp.]HVY13629.1 DUF6600 domain-containing protein [Rhodopila sp.]
MRWNPSLFRLCTSVAIGALLAEACLPVASRAQPAPPPLPSAQFDATPPADQNQPDPPARVGRIAQIAGTASFHDQGDTQWSPLSVNFPVSSGNTFWTEPNGRMRMEISDSVVAMSGATEFNVYSLDQTGLQGVAARGEIFLDMRNVGPNESWTIQTPRGLVHLNGNGQYGIVVGTTDDPTLVTVFAGSASVESTDLTLTVGPNQAASLTGTDTFQGVIVPAQRDPFVTEMLGAVRPPPSRLPPQVAETITAMPGGQDLSSVGSWSDVPEYGQVWYPPVDPGWVPYRNGHWAYVEPWGWTWVDDAPWGFAPFHYGRWVEIDDRWAWTPGPVVVQQPPVYAPALVAFIGLGAGVAIGAALASGSVGWVPLGPHEPYRPWYHASNRYFREVNVRNVTNINNITNIRNVTVNNFVNRRAMTAIPASAMAASRPVAPIARPFTPQQIAQARPVFGRQPIRPTAGTLGVTPTVARRLNIAAPGGVRPAAPGPAIRPVAGGPAPNLRGAFAPRTPLPGQHEPAPNIRPGAPVNAAGPHPGAPAMHPNAVIPNRPGEARPNVPETRPAEPHAMPPAVQPHVAAPPHEMVQPHVQAPVQHEAPRVQAPVQHAPPPQQHFNPPPQQHFNPPPQQHFNPPPQQHFTPPPQQHFSPPPQQHAAPPPGGGPETRPGEK